MAQNQVVLVDDIDGGEAEESVSFGLDGVAYEIDLSEGNAEALREALAPWVGHARRVAGRSRSGARRGGVRPRSAAPAAVDLAEVRSWARDNGYAVSDRGRLAGEVMAAYTEAH